MTKARMAIVRVFMSVPVPPGHDGETRLSRATGTAEVAFVSVYWT